MNQNSLTSTSENVSFQRSKNNFAICPALWYLTAVPQFRYKLETIAGAQQMKCSSLCLWKQWFHTLQVLTLKCQHNNSMARNPLLCDTAVLVFFYCWRYIHSFIHSSRSHWGITRYSHSCWGAVWQVGCRRCEWKLPTEFVPDFNLTDLPFVIIFLDISRQFPAPIFRSLFGSSVHTTFSSHSKKKQKNKFAEFVQCKFSFFPITWWRSVSFCVLVQPHWAARVAVVVSPQLPSLFKLWWVDRNV